MMDGSFGKFFPEVRKHFEDLRNGKWAAQGLNDGRNEFVFTHFELKVGIPGDQDAELTEVTREFIGITVPDIV